MARQPIYDRSGKVYGYEVLYRRAGGPSAGPMDAGDDAQALVNTLVEIGLERLVGEKVAFINVADSLLQSDAILLLPKERVVLELLETLEMDAHIEQRIKGLRALGYTLAYDDFVFEPEQFKFIPYVSLVKVDVMGCPTETIRAELPKLRRYGTKLLAEKVEEKAEHRRYNAWGFDYFQGYYYSKPEMLASKAMAPRHQVMLTLVAKLQDPDASLSQIEELVVRDPTFALRLLRLVNSASSGIKAEISSVKVALAMVGLEKVRAISTLLALAGQGDESPELMATGLIRGRMCEQLARITRESDPSQCFTAGLFSILDAMLDSPMATIVESLPLDAELSAALIDPGVDNSVGRILSRALAYGRGDWASAVDRLEDPERLVAIYLEAADWARDLEATVAAA